MNMKEKKTKNLTYDSSITIEPSSHRIVVSIAGKVVADSRRALVLKQDGYSPVHYIPRKDVNMKLLVKSGTETYCPFKGDCSLYSIPIGGQKSVNAAWSYEDPYFEVDEIKEHIAFYADRVDAIAVEELV